MSVSAKQELLVTVLDPLTTKYRSIGFIDLSTIKPPVIVPPSPPPSWDPREIFGDLLSQLASDDPSKRQFPRRGSDITSHITISLSEALHGVQKQTEVQRDETCPTCAGSGARLGSIPEKCTDCQGTGLQKERKETSLGTFVSAQSCTTCNGTGQTIPNPCSTCQGRTLVKTKVPLTITIPSGVDSGTRTFLPNQGEPGENGGRSGYVEIIITVAEHPLFTRIGRDISIHLPVRASFAEEGGQLQVPGMEKESYFLLNLPSNTQDGSILRVYENEFYTLDAVIDIYRPYDLIALYKIQKRLRAIKKALNHRDYEIRMGSAF